jgi:hypothetical protein
MWLEWGDKERVQNLGGESPLKSPLGRPRSRCEDNVNKYPRVIGCEEWEVGGTAIQPCPIVGFGLAGYANIVLVS